MARAPLVFSVPLLATGTVASIPFYGSAQLFRTAGSLRALTTGPVTVEIRQTGVLIDTLQWNAGGRLNHVIDPYIVFDEGDFLQINVIDLGVGAVDCVITLWLDAT